MAVQSSTWASRLFDCNTPENAGLCCYGLFCAPCLYGQNVESLPREEVCCGGNAWGSCLVFSLLGAVGAHCLVHSRTRRWIRNKYNIRCVLQSSACRSRSQCTPCASTLRMPASGTQGPRGALQPGPRPSVHHPLHNSSEHISRHPSGCMLYTPALSSTTILATPTECQLPSYPPRPYPCTLRSAAAAAQGTSSSRGAARRARWRKRPASCGCERPKPWSTASWRQSRQPNRSDRASAPAEVRLAPQASCGGTGVGLVVRCGGSRYAGA